MIQVARYTVTSGEGQTVAAVDGELIEFSAFRCFPMLGDPEEMTALRLLCRELGEYGDALALYRHGPFLDFMLDHAADALAGVHAIVDPDAGSDEYRGLRCVRSAEKLPEAVAAVFICETRAEPCMRIGARLGNRAALTPALVASFGPDLAPRCWIGKVASIYPMALPELVVRPGLDVLLLDMPARAGQQVSVGTSYVHTALKRTKVRLQTLDLDPLWYHRFQIHRLLDLGCEPTLPNGIKISADAWGYNERIWVDPRQWPFLLDFFAEDIREVLDQIVAAKPKVLAMSVHARNEWVTRYLARQVKQQLPETVILVGGHSCYSEHFGRGAFPEHDYMIIGEADSVVGGLVERLTRGERPKNLPGVISVHDDPGHRFLPGPQPHNLDALDGIALDFWDDLNQMYRTYDGHHSTALPLTRGCVWSRCTFCAERFAFRSRSPSKYVDEMEAIMATGRSGDFMASDSDYGGRPEILHQVCEEIVRRGLKISFSGQIRLNKNYDVEFFKLMRAAGMRQLNFGADAFTENTVRLQAKGYTIETLISNHRDCVAAGLTPVVNIVIGVPGETNQDIDDTVRLISEHRDYFPMLNNVNAALLVQNSVYWFEPEKHNIFFYGDKDALYRKFYFGIPARYWYSTEPYIDRAVRIERFVRLIEGVEAAGTRVSPEVRANLKDLMGGVGHLEFRELMVDDCIDQGQASVGVHRPAPIRAAAAPLFRDRVFAQVGEDILSFQDSGEIVELLESTGVTYWGATGTSSIARAAE